MELILWVAQGPAVPPFMYNRMNRTLLCSSGNLECLILRQREHFALKQSRSSWALENGEGVATLGGFRLGWRWRLAMTSKLGLEGCNLCCQLGDVLLSGHGGVLAQGLQGLTFLLLSGHVQDRQ